jgi:hypothetical protein
VSQGLPVREILVDVHGKSRPSASGTCTRYSFWLSWSIRAKATGTFQPSVEARGGSQGRISHAWSYNGCMSSPNSVIFARVCYPAVVLRARAALICTSPKTHKPTTHAPLRRLIVSESPTAECVASFTRVERCHHGR